MSQILIIEDDEAIADLEKDYLEMSGYSVDISTDGNEGLQMALKLDYDLLIVDIMLPGVDGFEICKKIRETKETPLLFVSARKDDIDKIRGLGLGADDYITKPFSPSELVARVGSHLARYNRIVSKGRVKEDNQIIEIRGLRIDKNNMHVWYNNEEIKMTAKEMELLIFFAEHPNVLFSKEELFERVWDMGTIGDVKTVTVHINRLRDKIELNPQKPQFIETIWGIGYRFKV